MKKKVLHAVHWPKSGIVTLLRDMLPLFSRNLFEQHVVFFEHDAATMEQFRPISSSISTLHYSSSRVSAIRLYRALLNGLQPDILHTHSFLPSILSDRFVSVHCSHLITVHNTYPYLTQKTLKSYLKRWLSKRIFKKHDVKIVAVSKDVKKSLSACVSTANLITVIENGVALDTPREEICNDPQGDYNLVSVGRLNPQKAYDVLLETLKLVLKKKPTIRLKLIGDGPEKGNLISLAVKLGIADNVDFTGWVDDPYSSIRGQPFIYVCSSKYEGFGLSVAEAMSIGVPVVATNVSGIRTFVRDKETGFLVSEEAQTHFARKFYGHWKIHNYLLS